MVKRVFRAKADCSLGMYRAINAAANMLKEKEMKIATPPRRGKGLECRCRSCEGIATHPRLDAKSRTLRVRTNEKSRDRKKIAKKATVNTSPCSHYSRASLAHFGAQDPH